MTADALRAYYNEKALRLDELGATYSSDVPYRRFFYGARFAAVMKVLAPAPGERILELGCGSGYYTRALAAVGADVTATDLAENYLEQARAFVGDELGRRVRFRCEDAQRLSSPDGCFDKVLMTEVLEHLPEPERGLAEAVRVLRPGGLLVVSTPSRCSPLNLAYALKRRVRGYDFNEHLREFTAREFRALLERHVRVERLEFANFLLPYPLDLLFLRPDGRGVATLAALERRLARTAGLRRLGWTMVAAGRKP